MSGRTIRWGGGGLVVLALLSVASPASAAVLANSGDFDVFGGLALPGPELDEDLTFGIRFGFNASSRLSFELGLAFLDTATRFTDASVPGGERRLDFQALVLDLSFARHFLPRRRATPMVFAGPGWVNVSGDLDPPGPGPRPDLGGLDENSLSLHGGGGVRIELTRGTYLRAEWRARWLNERQDDPVDSEITLGFGYYF